MFLEELAIIYIMLICLPVLLSAPSPWLCSPWSLLSWRAKAGSWESWSFDVRQRRGPCLCPCGPGVTGEQQQSWPRPGPTCLGAALKSSSQPRTMKGVWHLLTGRCQCAAALSLVLMTSVFRGQDNPAFKPTLWASGAVQTLLWPETV